MVGEGMTGRGRNDFENFSGSSEKVCVLSFLWCVCLYDLTLFFLGKRTLAQKAEADFFALLRDCGVAQQGAVWKEASRFSVYPTTLLTLCTQVKKTISADPRYDAVGSSSLREELFNTFLTSQSNQPDPDPIEKPAVDATSIEGADEAQKRKDRKAHAVKEREEKIKAERDRVQASIEKSRVDLNKEEGELQFRCAMLPTLDLVGRVLALKAALSSMQDSSNGCYTGTTGTRGLLSRAAI